MAVYSLAYNHGTQSIDFPEGCSVDWIEPAYVPPAIDPLAVVREALKNPVDGRPLSSYQGVKSVAIAINDKTRPVPHEHLLPPLLDELQAMGIPARAIHLVIATGTHLPMQADEFNRILPGDIPQRYSVLSHNCDDKDHLVYCGTTSRGTPVWSNRDYLEADLRIVVGNIEPHHFAGFSGGYKTAAIGLSGRDTINKNHVMLMDPNARIAEFDQNPLRQDIEEMGDMIGVHFALNVILNGEKRIVKAVSGHPRAVMQAGIPISQTVCQTPARMQYDIVIASAGGAPKDINFYQSQKALTHASLFTRDGGVIILAAACPEGSGSRGYEEFMQGIQTSEEVFEKFRSQGFRVGPHKAFQVARIAQRVKIVLLSEMPADQVSKLLMTPAASLSEAFTKAQSLLSPTQEGEQPAIGIRIAMLPRATNTIPV